MVDALKKISSINNTSVTGEELGSSIAIHFTRNKEFIKQYKELREKLYKTDPRFIGFRLFSEEGTENYEDDPDDQMLIIHDGKKCLGGACLRVSTPKKPIVLNLELDIMPPKGKKYYSFCENFPKLELDKYSYAEFVRIAIDPSLRNGSIIRQMFHIALDRCIKYRIRYMFGFGDYIRTRFYRQVYINMGLDCIIHKKDIPMRPEYEGVKMSLIAGDMKKFHITQKDPEAKILLKPRTNFQFTD